jgi:hypothetical protein
MRESPELDRAHRHAGGFGTVGGAVARACSSVTNTSSETPWESSTATK